MTSVNVTEQVMPSPPTEGDGGYPTGKPKQSARSPGVNFFGPSSVVKTKSAYWRSGSKSMRSSHRQRTQPMRRCLCRHICTCKY